jgi:hypothetical protein
LDGQAAANTMKPKQAYGVGVAIVGLMIALVSILLVELGIFTHIYPDYSFNPALAWHYVWFGVIGLVIDLLLVFGVCHINRIAVSQLLTFRQMHPLLTFVFAVFIWALFLMPLVYGYVVYDDVTNGVDVSGECNYHFIESWIIFFFGAALIFVFCLFCAFLLVSAYWFLGHLWKRWFRRQTEFAA